MAIRDYWVYQKRDTPKPRALYIVKEYDRRNRKDVCIDYTAYHEDIATPTHSKSEVCLRFDDVSGYVNAIAQALREFSNVTDEDISQLHRSLTDIFND